MSRVGARSEPRRTARVNGIRWHERLADDITFDRTEARIETLRAGQHLRLVPASAGELRFDTATMRIMRDTSWQSDPGFDLTVIPDGILQLGTAATDRVRIGRLNLRTEIVGHLVAEQTVTFDTVYDNGSRSGAYTLDWNNGNKQVITLSGNVTMTFTAPPGPTNLVLVVKQDAAGGRSITWLSSVLWPGGTAPTLTSAANAVDMMMFFYDGTNYLGGFLQDFK